jgi:hypothetical protein
MASDLTQGILSVMRRQSLKLVLELTDVTSGALIHNV